MKYVKVKFNYYDRDLILYVLPEVLEGKTAGALAPEAHITDGELNDNGMSGISFAHVYKSGAIMRFGEIIGNREDLVKV